MPEYTVKLNGTLTEVWKVEADSEEEAMEMVKSGEGEWVSAEWDDAPGAEIVKE